jgi:outer membrane cobalamin receptor
MTTTAIPSCILSLFSSALLLLFVQFSSAQDQQSIPNSQPTSRHTVAIRGKVVDTKTGEGIAKAIVSIRERSLQTVTDEKGVFTLGNVPPGQVELYISTVGYQLLKDRVTLAGDHDVELEIHLGQQAAGPKESVTVKSDPLDPIQPGIASSNTLDNIELKNLATVIIDDPLRSVQTLPGVATSDDYNAHFSLRGSGFSHIGVYVDGVLLGSPFHGAENVQESGSITMFGSDVIDSVELISGGFPAKYGERTGAVLDLHTREGSHEHFSTHADVSMTALDVSSEGPIPETKRATWLVSARKSYIGTLLREWGTDYLTVGFTDLQAKLSFHPNSSQQLTVSSMLGSGWFRPGEDSIHYSHIESGQNNTALLNIGWNWILRPEALLHTQLSFVEEKAWNHDLQESIPFESRSHDVDAQQEFSMQLPAHHFLTAGWNVHRAHENFYDDYYDLHFPDFLISAAYRRSAWYSSAYLQDSWQIIPGRLQLNFGGRTEHFTPTGQNLWMPRANLALHLTRNDKLTFAWGEYGQFPDFRELWGEVYNPNLRAERSDHYILGLEHRLNGRTRIRIEAYDNSLRNGIYSPDQEWRWPRSLDLERGLTLFNGLLPPRLGPYQRNSLSGHTRGIEFILQRRSANRLSGWISYAYGYSRYSDPADQLSFWGDYDQRHTVNAYGSYRLSKTINLSGKYRFGTNFPVPGFYLAQGNNIYLVTERNQSRLPDYSRLDLRLSKAVYTRRRKLTVYTEVGNLLNHTNRACQVREIIQLLASCDNEFPTLPSAGMTLEF